MRKHHATEKEIYVRIYKKASGVASVTIQEALDVALSWGWIDAIKKSYDERSFLQRYVPRTAKSKWSKLNRKNVARLIAEGRMTPHGLRQVTAAKADGRWQAAYAPPSETEPPADLLRAIRAEPEAFAFYRTLNRQNLFALAYRTNGLKTPEGRARRIRAFVDMLKRGETIYPNPPPRKRQAAKG